MKRPLLTLFILICFISPLHAKDMREAAVMARKELKQTMERDKQSRANVKKSKHEITQEIDILKVKNAKSEQDIKTTGQRIAFLQTENIKLEKEVSLDKAELDELSGAVRVAAGNLNAILQASMLNY